MVLRYSVENNIYSSEFVTEEINVETDMLVFYVCLKYIKTVPA